jgi:hypothetical protein
MQALQPAELQSLMQTAEQLLQNCATYMSESAGEEKLTCGAPVIEGISQLT